MKSKNTLSKKRTPEQIIQRVNYIKASRERARQWSLNRRAQSNSVKFVTATLSTSQTPTNEASKVLRTLKARRDALQQETKDIDTAISVVKKTYQQK